MLPTHLVTGDCWRNLQELGQRWSGDERQHEQFIGIKRKTDKPQ
jgi:hypothetical protein